MLAETLHKRLLAEFLKAFVQILNFTFRSSFRTLRTRTRDLQFWWTWTRTRTRGIRTRARTCDLKFW